MSWLLLGVLAIIWVAFLLPSGRRSSPNRSVEDFERHMELLADTDGQGTGRWIVTPRKGVPFIGPRARAQARARERRRKVFVFLAESIGMSFLIGLVPPLHAMWYVTAFFFTLLGVYSWMLASMKQRTSELDPAERVRAVNHVPARPLPARYRYASDAGGSTRPVFNGLGTFDTDEVVNVVVRPASEVGAARV